MTLVTLLHRLKVLMLKGLAATLGMAVVTMCTKQQVATLTSFAATFTQVICTYGLKKVNFQTSYHRLATVMIYHYAISHL